MKHVMESICRVEQQILQQSHRYSTFSIFFFTWVRLEVFCRFGQEVKHRLVGHLNFLMKDKTRAIQIRRDVRLVDNLNAQFLMHLDEKSAQLRMQYLR